MIGEQRCTEDSNLATRAPTHVHRPEGYSPRTSPAPLAAGFAAAGSTAPFARPPESTPSPYAALARRRSTCAVTLFNPANTLSVSPGQCRHRVQQ
jgi:hypothetical protein